jgi:hypothetical protein
MCDAAKESMGLLIVLAILLAFAGVVWACVYALRPKKEGTSHGWLAVLPLVVIFGWVLETILVH